MSAFYYVLGVVAKMNAALYRHRINFLPLNVLAIGIMVFVGFGTATDTVESMHNASTPVAVSLAQIHVDPQLAQNYIAVNGEDFPVALYEYGSKSDKGDITSVETSWTPLVDRQSQRILLVQRPGKVKGGEPHDTTITGMLRELNTDLRSRLAARHDTIQGLPVETRYMLVAGAVPANSTTSALITVILFAIVALFVIAIANRNTIFHTTDLGSPLFKVKTAESLIVKTTGTFAFDQSGTIVEKRFVGVPAMLAHRENGEPALFSNIDASNRFMGFTTSERSGLWCLAIDAGSVQDTEAGYFYWGTARRPGVRFSYTTGRGAKRRALIAADDASTLSAALALLTTRGTPHDAPTW